MDTKIKEFRFQRLIHLSHEEWKQFFQEHASPEFEIENPQYDKLDFLKAFFGLLTWFFNIVLTPNMNFAFTRVDNYLVFHASYPNFKGKPYSKLLF